MSSSEAHITTSDSDADVVVIDRDDVSNYNPEQILPESSENIKKIRTWLEPTSYDIAGGEYRKHLASHVAGTGDWLTSAATYQEWLQSDEHGLLWIKGIPGSGKSVMAANLISEISKSNPDCPVLFFFFRQIIEANHKPEALLRDWMDQVLDYSPPLQKQLKTYVEAHRPIDSISMEDMMKSLELAFVNLPKKVFCVADALDEMDRGQDIFLQALGSLGLWKPNKVKVLITSRPVPTVEGPLRKTPCLHLRLQENLVDLDISTYVRYTLSRSTIPQSHWQTITDAVPGRANGLFLYAKLAMDAFLEPGADIKTVLSQLPADLNVLYTDLLREHAQRSGVAPEIQHLILQSVTHATRPLRLLELAEMIKVNSPDGSTRDLKATKDLIRAACGPLLEILADETVSVIHHSFTEYLKGTTRSDGDTGYPILQRGPTHTQLALACLRYRHGGCYDEVEIKDDYQVDSHDSVGFGYFDDFDHKPDPKLEVQLRLKHPFFNYAASNWHHHIHRSEASEYDQTEVNIELHKFLEDSKAMKAWLQIKWPSAARGIGSITQLHIAAKAGLISYVKEILPSMEVDAIDAEGCTPLWWAASEGHAIVVRELIAAGANPDQSENINGLKPLHEAASKNHDEVVRILLEAGVNPLTPKTREYPGRRCGNAPTSTGQTPLMYACRGGHLEAVEAFLPFLDNIDIVHRALAWAAETGRSKIVARILEYPGVDVNCKPRGDTPLYLACGNRDIPTIKTLLQAGANPSIDCDDAGDEWEGMGRCFSIDNPPPTMNCMHHLCGLGYKERHGSESEADILQTIFSFLVDAGVNIHQRTHSGQTALHGAVSSPVLTRLLLDAGADANATDYSGAAPLHRVTKIDAMALLIEEGHADINLAQKNGKTPLLNMLSTYHRETALKFLEYGPNCNIIDETGNGVLHISLSHWSSTTEIIKALLEAGADPNLKNRGGLTPLLSMRDNLSNSAGIVDLLLEAGANINAMDKEGATLFFRSISTTSYTSSTDAHQELRDLIDRGASISVRNFNGRTALHEAVKHHSGDQPRGSRSKDISRFDFLVGLGLDINAVDHSGNNLLHEYALHSNNHDSYYAPKTISFWEQLLAMGFSLEQKNYAGRTPLHILCAANTHSRHFKQGNVMPIDFAIARTKNLDAADKDGITPLHLAATGGERYVKKLLDAGADPRVFTHEGLTPLHLASRCRESNVVGLLLDALRRTQETSTAANSSSQLEKLDNLSSREAKKSPKSVSGVNAKTFGQGPVTPLFYACRSGTPETVALLLEAGADVKTGTAFQACVEFEEENALWKEIHQSTDGRGNGNAIALKLNDLSRRQTKPQCDRQLNELNEHGIARLEEILDLLVKYGADISELKDPKGHIDAIDSAVRNNHDYTAACMRDVWNKNGTGSMEKSYLRSFTKLSEVTHQSWKEVSAQALKDMDLIKPGDCNQDMFCRFLIRREYHLVEELARLGTECLPMLDRDDTCNLAILIKHGFASLVEKIGTFEAESRLGKGDWHAFGDKTRLGLWFASRDLSDARHRGQNPVPFLIEAVRRELPNMDVVRLLVEKFAVDINEQHYTHEYTQDGYKTVPSDSALHRVSRGDFWWNVHQALPYLLEAGADIHIRNHNGQTPLHMALRADGWYPGPFHIDAAKILVEAGADVNAVDGAGASCLACAQHSIDMTRLLVSHGAIVTAEALFAAIDAKDVLILRELLSGGVNPNIRRDKPCEEALKRKKERGDLFRLVSELEPYDEFPLYHAAMASQLANSTAPACPVGNQLVQVLLDHGADPFAKFLWADEEPDVTPDKQTPSIEVPEGFEECTVLHEVFLRGGLVDQFLYLRGLDVNHRDAKGRNLLHAACQGVGVPDHVIGSHGGKTDQSEHVTVFQRLISLGAELEARDNLGRNILHCMIGFKDGPEFDAFKDSLEDVLKKAPHLANEGDENGNTPLHYAITRAVTRKNTGIAKILLAAGADPLVINKNGDNVLHTLAQNLHAKVLCDLFQELAGRGVDVNRRNAQGKTPLFAYCKREKRSKYGRIGYWGGSFTEKEEATPMLQKLGADFLARDAKGRGLLHVAASGDFDRFKELLDMGLDAMLEDDAQQTAIDVAAACGNEEVLALFEKKD